MTLPDFRLLRPGTLREALVALAAPGARALGGGTDLLVTLKQRRTAPDLLVDLTALTELRRIDAWPAGLIIGAGVRVAEVGAGVAHRPGLAALTEAVASLGSPPLRNTATLGGNLCLPPRCLFFNQSEFWRGSTGLCFKTGGEACLAAPASRRCLASFAADLPPALMALGAWVRVARWDGVQMIERETLLDDLYSDDGLSWLRMEPGEVVVGVRIPVIEGLRTGYRKYRRRGSIEFPLAGVAAALRLQHGVMRDVRVVVGALASAPLSARETMALLEGRRPEPALLDEAAALVTRGTRPTRNQGDTPGQRRDVARVMCRRLLADLTMAEWHGGKAAG